MIRKAEKNLKDIKPVLGDKAVQKKAPKQKKPADLSRWQVRLRRFLFKLIMFLFFLVGLLWIIVYYVSYEYQLPIPAIGQGNIFAGFFCLLIGFIMATRWKDD